MNCTLIFFMLIFIMGNVSVYLLNDVSIDLSDKILCCQTGSYICFIMLALVALLVLIMGWLCFVASEAESKLCENTMSPKDIIK